MKQNFEIYPALFVLTANRENQRAIVNHFEWTKNLYRETKCDYDLAYPHVHYGNCLTNATHTQFTLYISNEITSDEGFDLPDKFLGQLRSETFQGKKYVITFVPVKN